MINSEIKVIKQKPIVAIVADSIRKAIESRELTPGQKIGEEEMSARLQVSRTPVREAFRILETEGYLSHSPRCGVIVTELRREDIIEIYEIRSYLEQLMVRKTAENIEEEGLSRLNEIGLQMARDDEIDEEYFHRLDGGFHEVIVSNCGNYKLEEIVKNLKISTKLIRNRAGYSPQRARESFRECIELISAINNRNGDHAAALMKVHFDYSLAFFLGQFDNFPT